MLLEGDCLERLAEIPAASVDLILSDPPYGTTQCKWDSVIPLDRMWGQLRRVAKPGCPIVLTASQPFTSILVASNLPWFRYDWIWEKTAATGHLNAKKMPLRAHESVLVFCDRACRYFPQKTTGHTPVHSYTQRTSSEVYGAVKSGISGGGSTERYPRSVQVFPSDKQRSALHPTQKPLALMEYLVRTYSLPRESVLDFCMGSGTTGVACRRLGRDFIGVERDPGHFATASQRIESMVPTLST